MNKNTAPLFSGLATRIVLVLSVFAVLLSSSTPALGAFSAENDDKIRVGFFAFSGYHEIDEEGTRTGYGYEFFRKIGVLDDWTFDYIGYDKSYAENLDMLVNGELDVVTSVSKTPERERLFLFSEEPIGTNATIFTVKSGNEDVISGDYSTYDGLSIGMLDGNSKNKNFEDFSKNHDFDYNPVYYDTEDELTQALQSEEVDGIVSGSLRRLQNEWLIESMNESDFYVVVNRDDTELMERINKAIHKLDLNEPDWRNVLRRKYYSMDSDGAVMLDADERNYLKSLANSGRKLRVLMNPDREPYSYFENGEPRGIAVEVFSTIAEDSGIPYEFIQAEDRNEYLELRDSGEADVVIDYTTSSDSAVEDNGYKLSVSYMESNVAQLSRKKNEVIKKIATIRNSEVIGSYLKSIYEDENILMCDNMSDCIDAVDRGEADAVLTLAYRAEKIIQNDVKNRYTYTLLSDITVPFYMGINSSEKHELISIINKELSALSEEKMSEIIMNEADLHRTRSSQSIVAMLYANPVYVMIMILFISLFAIVCIVLMFRTHSQKILQKRVEEVSRKYEIKEQELSEALAIADRASRAKTTFLNNMSHDIRTPMNAIIGFTALASTHIENTEKARDYLEKIAQSSNHLLSLINDVLDMSRIESGNVVIEEKPENLAEILHGLRNIIQADVHAKQLELYIDTVDVTEENIFCDKLRLNQILLNLLSNSIKFTNPRGTISLKVTQKPAEDSEHRNYEFIVKDTGIGMNPEFAKTIFEPFTRERTSTVSGIQGTGLGMSITKNIVDMMNGTIEVDSTPGAGTEFTVRLTFRVQGKPHEISVISELKGMRSLVVDDDIVSCQSVTKMLRQIGMRSEWTMYGKEAVVRTEEAHDIGDPYKVYIVDWSMPDMNGIETVRQIRKVIGDDAPIILFSAYDWTDIEDEARTAGVTDFISKPMFVTDLHNVLDRVMGKSEEISQDDSEEMKFTDRTVLLAEDNELNREIAVEILSNMGLDVETAENGREAVDLLCNSESGHFSIILMDVQMPVMDGYQATREIRSLKDPKLSSVPIVAMTANAFDEDRQMAIDAGMNGHLAKPFKIEQLYHILKQYL